MTTIAVAATAAVNVAAFNFLFILSLLLLFSVESILPPEVSSVSGFSLLKSDLLIIMPSLR